MQFLKIAAAVLLGVTEISVLVLALRGKRPFKVLFLSALCGIAGLAAVNLSTRFTGIHIPINPCTAASGALFGLPAVCGLVLLQLIF